MCAVEMLHDYALYKITIGIDIRQKCLYQIDVLCITRSNALTTWNFCYICKR